MAGAESACCGPCSKSPPIFTIWKSPQEPQIRSGGPFLSASTLRLATTTTNLSTFQILMKPSSFESQFLGSLANTVRSNPLSSTPHHCLQKCSVTSLSHSSGPQDRCWGRDGRRGEYEIQTWPLYKVQNLE